MRIRAERVLGTIVGVLGLVAVPMPPARAVTDADLALHWAPVHYQDTDDTDADYLSAVDFSRTYVRNGYPS